MANITINDSILLPPDLYWADEYSWSPVAVQEDVSVTGATILQFSKRQSGRRITLKSGSDTAWVTRAQLDALKTLEATLPESIPLELGDGRTFNVVFASGEQGQAVEADAVQPGKQPAPEDYFIVTIKFLEV